MTQSVFVSSFGATSLNSANVIQHYVIDSGSQPIESLLQDVSGNLYNADGTAAASSYPGELTISITVKGTDAATFVTNTSAIIAIANTFGTVTGLDANGGTITCTGRCQAVPIRSEAPHHTRFWQPYIITIKQVTKWA